MTLPDYWRQPQDPVTPDVLAEAFRHANAEAPREAVGVVVAGEYCPLINTHEVPEKAFRADFSAVDRIEAVIHSHPASPPLPSAADMRGQIAFGVPWAIIGPGEPGVLGCVWGLPRPALFDEGGHVVPRAFAPGVADCYSVIEDWYSARGIDLPPFPRDVDWWDYGDDLYRDGFAEAGFSQIAGLGEARPGDVYLMPLVPGLATPTHGGIYLGDGLCLEHMPGRLMARRPIGPKVRRITHWLRHEALA